METIIAIFVLILGLVFGSFFNVVGLRVPIKESILTPSSHCRNCQRRLTIVDLVPVLSYIILKGKCRNCSTKISPVYLLTELATGSLFAFAFWKIGIDSELVAAFFFISLLIIIVVSDFAYMLIPDKILLFFLPFLVAGRILSPLDPWWDSLLGAFISFGILLLIAILSKGGIGGGDIKLFFLIGLVLGTLNSLLTLFIASVIGMIFGVTTLKARGKGTKTPVPFGPAIALAAVIVYFYGDSILEWYSKVVI
ncbi:prepilin peptidase [Lysinibacillus telephonicus]|uniref:Prepilin peptidase n=1 Tax=Lysinibacillus telephonicus TaxID=1714840 RepID=A0A431UC90_9BACI|nr:A24 family peptidase [Lysinibacillus telephonicus]RTQ86592.1 prepilin peptidase [Lysinibacillus telephonicus]